MFASIRSGAIALLLPLGAACLAADGSQVFVKNQGQWDPRAKYMTPVNGGEVWLNDEGYVLNLHQLKGQMVTGQVVRVSFHTPASPTGTTFNEGELVPGKLNYFIGNKPSNWTTNVPRFAGTTAKNVASGLDVRYYFDQGSPRYDLVVAPGTDPSTIGMKIDGANGLNVLPNGNLQIETSLGPVEERGLYAYQQQGSTKVAVPCQMTVVGSTVHFNVASFDKSKPLIIDPLLFCTYYPAPMLDIQQGICSDASGNLITVGGTLIYTYPTTTGAFQTAKASYPEDYAGYISKLSADGTRLIFGSYLSGTGFNANQYLVTDTIYAVTIDSSGNLYLTGTAGSFDFPVTPGAYQTKKGDPTLWTTNAFVTEMSADGSHLVFSTFLGGSQTSTTKTVQGDYGSGIALDHHGNVIVGGYETTSNFPVTPGAYEGVRNANEPAEGFLAKLNPTGTTLVFSTFLEGGFVDPGYRNDGDQDIYRALIAADSADNIVLGGSIDPAFFKSTGNPLSIKAPAGGFVGKLSSDGTKMLFNIELGDVQSIALTPTGIAFVADELGGSALYPSIYDVAGTYHFVGGSVQTCLGQFSLDGTKLLHSAVMRFESYVGPAPIQLRTDAAGNLYLFDVRGTNLPTTSDAYQQSQGLAYLAELSPEQDRLLYGSYFGPSTSTGVPESGTFTMASINRFLLAGYTDGQAAMPITPGVYDSSINSVYAALLSLAIYTHVELTPNPLVGGLSLTGKVTIPAAATSTGAVITLTSSDAGVKMPATVTIPAGSVSQTFTVTTTGVVSSTTSTVGAKFGVGVGTAKLFRTQAVLNTLTSSATSMVTGQTATGLVTLNGSAGPGGDLVQLSSSNASLTVPASAVIYYGSNQAAFQVKAAAGTGGYTAQITAKLGSVTKTVSVEVAPTLTGLTVSSPSVVAGTTAQGVVKLSGKAGASGVAVSLSSSNVAATVPASVMVPSGATVVAFSISTAGVNVATAVTLAAKKGTLTQTAVITVQPAVLSFYTLTPSPVKGGTGVQGIVRLNGPAGPSGVSVALSSPSSLAIVPSKVMIAPGASYFVFAIGTKPVTTATQVSLKAGAITSVLTINP
jgi:hypothetical protein